MKKIFILTLIISLIIIGGCAQEKQQLVGNDRDSHGCIGSAGYSWCETKTKCLRVWEENCTETTN